jgi:hypothetical protein
MHTHGVDGSAPRARVRVVGGAQEKQESLATKIQDHTDAIAQKEEECERAESALTSEKEVQEGKHRALMAEIDEIEARIHQVSWSVQRVERQWPAGWLRRSHAPPARQLASEKRLLSLLAWLLPTPCSSRPPMSRRWPNRSRDSRICTRSERRPCHHS